MPKSGGLLSLQRFPLAEEGHSGGTAPDFHGIPY